MAFLISKETIKKEKIALIGALWGILFMLPATMLIADLCNNYSIAVFVLSFLAINALLAFIHARKNIRSFSLLFLVYAGITLLTSAGFLFLLLQSDLD